MEVFNGRGKKNEEKKKINLLIIKIISTKFYKNICSFTR